MPTKRSNEDYEEIIRGLFSLAERTDKRIDDINRLLEEKKETISDCKNEITALQKDVSYLKENIARNDSDIKNIVKIAVGAVVSVVVAALTYAITHA